MNRFLVVLMLGIHLICWGLLWLSCYPWAVYDAMTVGVFYLLMLFYYFPGAILIVLVAPVAGLIYWRRRRRLLHRAQSAPKPGQPYLRQWAIATSRMLFITAFILKTNLLQYVAFGLSLPAFTTFNDDCNQGCQVGFYHVENSYRDSMGGVYFQTSSTFLRTYGFVYKPHPPWNRGLPQQSFEYYPFWGDWQWFKESHDWN